MWLNCYVVMLCFCSCSCYCGFCKPMPTTHSDYAFPSNFVFKFLFFLYFLSFRRGFTLIKLWQVMEDTMEKNQLLGIRNQSVQMNFGPSISNGIQANGTQFSRLLTKSWILLTSNFWEACSDRMKYVNLPHCRMHMKLLLPIPSLSTFSFHPHL